jgi:hypothetical protein
MFFKKPVKVIVWLFALFILTFYFYIMDSLICDSASARFTELKHVLIGLDYSFISQNVDLPLYFFSTKITGKLVETREFFSGMSYHKNKVLDPKNRIIPDYPYSNSVAKNTLRSYILGNFDSFVKFITFTFDPSKNDFDLKDLSSCNLKKNILVKRIKKYFPKAKYIIIPELHESGRFHYHMLIDLPYLTKDNQAKLWPYGFVKVKAYKNIVGSVFYMTKYLTKNSLLSQFKNRRRYYCSNTLAKTVTFRGPEAEAMVHTIEALKLRPVISTRYPIQNANDPNAECIYNAYIYDPKKRSS